MSKYICLIISLLIATANTEQENKHEVEFIVFSGRPNPMFTISTQQYEKFNSLMTNKYKLKSVVNMMGYNGIYIHGLGIERKIRAEPEAELYLLSIFENDLGKDVSD
jgi:hypothetical protein